MRKLHPVERLMTKTSWGTRVAQKTPKDHQKAIVLDEMDGAKRNVGVTGTQRGMTDDQQPVVRNILAELAEVEFSHHGELWKL